MSLEFFPMEFQSIAEMGGLRECEVENEECNEEHEEASVDLAKNQIKIKLTTSAERLVSLFKYLKLSFVEMY